MTIPAPSEKPRPAILRPPDTDRDRSGVSPRLVGAAIGGVAGALFGYFLIEFGFAEILGNRPMEQLELIGIVVGAALGALKLHWLVVGLDALMFVFYLAIANTGIMFRLATEWARSDPIPASADAIIVLSAAINSDGMLNTQGVQRLLTGLELYQRGVAPRLFTTNVDATYGRQVLSSTADQGRIIKLAGAASGWTSLTGVSNTREEAIQSAAKLPTEARTVIVVTSPLHTRRACATFERMGFKVVCVPSREHDHVTWHPIHSSDRLASFRDYLYERLGMVKYRHQGWVR